MLQPNPFSEPYPLPRDAVETVLRKWMAGAELNAAEVEVVDYANRANQISLRERLAAVYASTVLSLDDEVAIAVGGG